MKVKSLGIILLFLATLLMLATPGWARTKGYCYVIGYSLAKKTAYFSPIIPQEVDSTSYSAEEYVTDVEVIQKLESQFQKYLAQTVNLDADGYTVSARGAFKSNAIADKRLKDEMGIYKHREFKITIAKDFKLSD
jgi:hypothetical protein